MHINDYLRGRFPLCYKPDVTLITRAFSNMYPEDSEDREAIFKMIREFNEFTEDNDPWKEHDFGMITYNGKDIMWKIDYYEGTDGYRDVMTVMLAEDY